MLSVLIPVYNCNVTNLVSELSRQLKLLNIRYEILLVDDHSDKYFNENSILASIEGVSYEYLKQNIGRSRIRNYLASKAKFENLLFLDSDSEIIHPGFIANYLDNSNSKIIYGGTTYSPNKINKKKLLHYIYGTKREIKSLEKRRNAPYLSFKTNNFFIKKNIFDKIHFDESITDYGHEDTVFAFELKNQDIEILHIDNPVEHTGIESNEVFLSKVKQSVETLFFISTNSSVQIENNFRQIPLMKYFFKLKKYYLCGLFSCCYNLFNKPIEKNLKGSNPKLFFLDLLKLMYICYIQKNYKKKKL